MSSIRCSIFLSSQFYWKASVKGSKLDLIESYICANRRVSLFRMCKYVWNDSGVGWILGASRLLGSISAQPRTPVNSRGATRFPEISSAILRNSARSTKLDLKSFPDKENLQHLAQLRSQRCVCWLPGTFGYPDSKVHGANISPIWGRQDPDAPCCPHEPWYLGSDGLGWSHKCTFQRQTLWFDDTKRQCSKKSPGLQRLCLSIETCLNLGPEWCWYD